MAALASLQNITKKYKRQKAFFWKKKSRC